MILTEDIMDTPENIYLIDTGDEICWDSDPAPGAGMDAKDAVEYIRADKVKKLRRSGVGALIFEAMQDIYKNADDTYWIGDSETVFERLTTIFLASGGDNKALVKEWPEMF